MKPFWMMMRGVRTAVRARRRMRGPLRPSWDEAYETWATVLHHYSKRSTLLPLSQQRKAIDALVRPTDHVRETTFEHVDANGVPAEWFRRDDTDTSRAIYYLHGGGYSIGSIHSHRDFLARLCRASGVSVFAIDYRLAPEHPFPAQLDDSLAAYRWLCEHGVAPEHVVIGGESAGGGLTLSTLVSLKDAGEPLPAAAFCISPWVDLEASSPSIESNAVYDYVQKRELITYARRFVQPRDMRNPLAAPLYAELAGLPPLLLLAGGAETLLDDSVRLARRAREQGVEVQLDIWPDHIHAWPLFAGAFADSRKAIEEIGAWAKRQLGVRRSSADSFGDHREQHGERDAHQ